MLFVQHTERIRRLEICKACTHYVPETQSCGPLIAGKTIKRGRGSVRLCGCIMPLKTKFKVSGCPLKKWDPLVKVADLDAWEATLNSLRNTINASEQAQLLQMHSIATGSQSSPANCSSCWANIIHDMRVFIARSRKQMEEET
jgi:hypothetical protein